MDLNVICNKNTHSYEYVYSITSGSITGAIEILTLWPFEYIKTKLQLYPHHKKFNNIKTCGIYTIKKYGYSGLYHGMSPILMSNILNVGTRFGTYTYTSNYFRRNNSNILEPKHVFYSGIITGTVEATFITTPIESIKTKLIMSGMSTCKGIQQIYDKNGIRGFYSGYVPTLIKSMSNRGIQFYLFEKYRIMLSRDYNVSTLNPYYSFIGGMGSGLISTIVNNPVDVIKTQMQKQSFLQKSSMQTILNLYHRGGLSIFYTGFLSRVMYIVPSQGIVFMSYYYIYDIVKNIYNDIGLS